jgi:hypothetical protein
MNYIQTRRRRRKQENVAVILAEVALALFFIYKGR